MHWIQRLNSGNTIVRTMGWELFGLNLPGIFQDNCLFRRLYCWISLIRTTSISMLPFTNQLRLINLHTIHQWMGMLLWCDLAKTTTIDDFGWHSFEFHFQFQLTRHLVPIPMIFPLHTLCRIDFNRPVVILVDF